MTSCQMAPHFYLSTELCIYNALEKVIPHDEVYTEIHVNALNTFNYAPHLKHILVYITFLGSIPPHWHTVIITHMSETYLWYETYTKVVHKITSV